MKKPLLISLCLFMTASIVLVPLSTGSTPSSVGIKTPASTASAVQTVSSSPTPSAQPPKATPASVVASPRVPAVKAARRRHVHPHVHKAPTVRRTQLPQRSSGGGSLPAVLYRIEKCESGGRNINNSSGSSASGYWQITDGTWAGFGGYSRAIHAPRSVQARKALALYRDRGTQPWVSSRGCWS